MTGTWSHTRITVLGIGFLVAGVAGGLGEPYPFADVWGTNVWRLLFSSAGAATVAFAGVRRRPAAAVSAVLVAIAGTARACALLSTTSRAWPGVLVYVALVSLVVWGWPRAADELEAELLVDRRSPVAG